MTDPRFPQDMLQLAAKAMPEQVALICGEEQLTYRELSARVEIAAKHVASGSVVQYRATRDIDGVVSAWAIRRAGSVAFPLDPVHPRPMVVAQSELPGDAAFVVATSGSTGTPLLAILTNGNIAAATAASSQQLGTDSRDSWLNALPLHHIAGLSILWRAARDGSTVLLVNPFDSQHIHDHVASGAVAWMSLVPTMLARLVDIGMSAGNLRGIMVGGAPVGADLMRRAEGLGLPVLATYGMTETCAQVATVPPPGGPEWAGTVGLPLPGVGISFWRGRVVVSGPTVCYGYVGQPPFDGKILTDDLGFFDSDMRLVITGRADRVIITGGENVHPEVVEAALVSIDGVTEAAVVGVADRMWGHRLVAAVVASVDVDALYAELRPVLPPFAIPKHIEKRTDMPRLPSGKVDLIALETSLAAWSAGE